ncbi:hypothetical protein [Microbacterium sp.]|uniref:hypothetical protein n=1 Tax=Microbacterium sp. TaxID=51671 RepID=UPI0033426161
MTDTITFDISGLSPEAVGYLTQVVADLRTADQELTDHVDVELPDWRNAVSTGWTLDHVEQLRRELAVGRKDVQLAAFDQALQQDGYISRGDLYALAGYDQDRRLNNWTTPFRKAVARMVAEDDLPESAALPMEPVYRDDVSGYQQALGFQVAPEIVKLMNEQG